LAGGQKSKSHHVYQIYVRIKDEEWNVYRRYSQFHSLHKTLRKKYQILNTFDFPPKKTIGNKDSKVVQERRKKLEHYLRSLINYLQTQHNDISDKQNLIQILPFLRFALKKYCFSLFQIYY
jgi:sorting nexin-29